LSSGSASSRGDGQPDHGEGVRGVGAGDYPQPGRVGEEDLGGLAVVLDRADAAAERDADHDRQLHVALRPVVHLGKLADDLVGGREDEAVELDLADRAVAAQREPDRGADDAGFGERGIHHPVLAEVLLQPVGDPEHAAEPADVLAHDHGFGVVFQCPAQSLVERLREREPRHRAASSNPSRYAS
jgi:hypothetical protein